jgi:hypothetical protein
MVFYISLVVVMIILNYKVQGWLTWISRWGNIQTGLDEFGNNLIIILHIISGLLMLLSK